jgi:hypothetical protein
MLTPTIEDFIRIWSSRGFFSVEAVSGESKTFRGHGTIKVSTPDCFTVIFEEHGVWTSFAHSNLAFSNVYRWDFEPESLRTVNLRAHAPLAVRK